MMGDLLVRAVGKGGKKGISDVIKVYSLRLGGQAGQG
jgi:hypothetical protein